MAQTLSPAGFGARRTYPHAARATEGPSRYLSSISRADGPETPLVVEFTGISEAQQRAAIRAFPGGRRFVLAEEKPPETLLGQS
jgi:hypothetical protein